MSETHAGWKNYWHKRFQIPLKRLYWFSGGWIGARYIYRELIFPFIFSIGVVTFILLANFLIKSVDRLLGKGLPAHILLEFLYLNLAWIIAMAVPMAVLVAALMAYGRLAEDNEITALRSSGISFLTIITPSIIFGTVICAVMIYFHNAILPEFNHRARLLASAIYRQRPGLTIEPGYFIDDIPEYSIYVKEKSGESLRKITIYNKDAQDIQTTIYADSGFIAVDGNVVLFTLYRGQIHEIDLRGLSDYRRIDFAKHRIAIPMDNLLLERREQAVRGDREMTIAMMQAEIKRFAEEQQQVEQKIFRLVEQELQFQLAGSAQPAVKDIRQQINPNLHSLVEQEFQSQLADSAQPAVKDLRRKFNTYLHSRNFAAVMKTMDELKEYNTRNFPTETAQARNRRLVNLANRLKAEYALAQSYKKQVYKYAVEVHKKYSIPFACIIFVVIGAPLGVMTRRGGITVAATMSIIFFLIYYIFLIGGEELADAAVISPFWAMWTPNILLGIIGIYLIYYTTYEQRILRLPRFLNFMRAQNEANGQ